MGPRGGPRLSESSGSAAVPQRPAARHFYAADDDVDDQLDTCANSTPPRRCLAEQKTLQPLTCLQLVCFDGDGHTWRCDLQYPKSQPCTAATEASICMADGASYGGCAMMSRCWAASPVPWQRRYEFRQACRKAGLSFREAEEVHSRCAAFGLRAVGCQVSIFEACAETKGKLQLPVFLKLLHGDAVRSTCDVGVGSPVPAVVPSTGAVACSPSPRGASLRGSGRRERRAAGSACERCFSFTQLRSSQAERWEAT